MSRQGQIQYYMYSLHTLDALMSNMVEDFCEW